MQNLTDNHFRSSSPAKSGDERRQRVRRKLPASYNGIVLPFLLSVFMTSIISAISTLLAVGVSANVWRLWLAAWAWSWAIGFPTLLVVLPIVRRIVAALVEQPTACAKP